MPEASPKSDMRKFIYHHRNDTKITKAKYQYSEEKKSLADGNTSPCAKDQKEIKMVFSHWKSETRTNLFFITSRKIKTQKRRNVKKQLQWQRDHQRLKY